MIRESKLIDACVSEGIFSSLDLENAKSLSRKRRESLFETLMFAHRMPSVAFYKAFAINAGVKFLDANDIKVDGSLLKKMPRSLVEGRLSLPIKIENISTVPVVLADPTNISVKIQLEKIFRSEITLFMSMPDAIQQVMDSAFKSIGVVTDSESEELDPVEELNNIFKEAYLYRSSDIHFESNKNSIKIRFRVDGRLQDYSKVLTKESGLSIISRIKVLSGLDISEQRMPQDGSFTHSIKSGYEFDIRVATLPTRFGERVTMRVLGSDTEALTLETIGMSNNDLLKFSEIIEKPHGMVLITGPTGSGKTTTLYSVLQRIKSGDTNILTVEDPIEYVMDGISQVHVGTKVSFASALRSFLRHDPDIIMVGEIRDGETANIAMKASMTGHLVFSTLHTNSTVAAVTRLKDLGSEPYLIGATLLAVISQRLVRRLCDICKEEYQLVEEETEIFKKFENRKIYRAKGCASCLNIGYKGRIAIFETFWIDSKISKLISDGCDEITLINAATDLKKLSHDAVQKVIEGQTTIDEIKRIAVLD
tara:strand:+ start:3006 stop:4613 length:1608 start_codon:yes stop_codon:yes gene_type:complete